MVRSKWFVFASILIGAVGCTAPTDPLSSVTTPHPVPSDTASPSSTPTPPGPTPNTTVMPSSDQSKIDPMKRAPKDGDPVAVITTDKGVIVCMFFPDKAPNHVANFEGLANNRFYDGTKFHRTMPGFMIQGGDPNTKGPDASTYGQGGPGFTVKAEFNNVHHARGILSMARSQDPDSAGSQFFIMVGDKASLDNQYTAFGKVVTGMDVADKIVALPSEAGSGTAKQPVTVRTIRIEKWPLKA